MRQNTEKTKKIRQVKTQKKSKNKKKTPNKNTKSKQKHKKVKNNKSHNTAKNKQKKQKIWEKEEKQMLERKLKKAIAQILLIIAIAIATVTIISIPAGKVYASILEPANDQKIEYRAISQEVVNGKKQLIIEVRIRKLKFKGIDLRLQYNTALLTPSNIETNAAIDVNDADGIPSNYTYINGFEKYMDMLEIEGTTGELRMVYSILGEDERTGTNNYYKEETANQPIVEVADEAIIGKISFQMEDETAITTDDIKLKTGSTSPTTGIKVVTSESNNYQAQSLFEFTLDLKSKNANLKKIEISNGNNEEGNYRSYDLNPTFDKDTLEYETKIVEYIDSVNLKTQAEDAKSTIKIKYPKKDKNGKTERDNNGNIVYEEKKITDTSQEIQEKIELNKLGEEDTIIEITVTAEKQEIQKTYKIHIKRPYGKIKGKIQLGNGLKESMDGSYGITMNYVADLRIYKQDQINWDDIIQGNLSLDDVDSEQTEKTTKSDDEGNYEIYVIPGKYDFYAERQGFLADITTKITINENDEIDLGTKILYEGDADRSGIIDLNDTIEIVNSMGASKGDSTYSEKYDFGQKGYVSLDNMVSVVGNLYKTITIEEHTG